MKVSQGILLSCSKQKTPSANQWPRHLFPPCTTPPPPQRPVTCSLLFVANTETGVIEEVPPFAATSKHVSTSCYCPYTHGLSRELTGSRPLRRVVSVNIVKNRASGVVAPRPFRSKSIRYGKSPDWYICVMASRSIAMNPTCHRDLRFPRLH